MIETMASSDIKIISIGGATQDVFLMGKALHAKRDVRAKDYVEQFPLGAKIDVDEIRIETGGGATNAAVTFARQGLGSHFLGKIGPDVAGEAVLKALADEGIATQHVARDRKFNTSYSTIMLSPSGERTILNYRGASHNLSARDYNLSKIDADWFYVTSLAGNFDLLGKLIKHAKRNGIKVLFNPGLAELAKPKKLLKLVPDLEVLYANADEMAKLFEGDNHKELMFSSFGICPYVLMTDGHGGAYLSDGNKIYRAGLYKNVTVVDRTGAGDAFGSGFVAGMSQGWGLQAALTLASANATSVVTIIGAKPGILHRSKLKPLKLEALGV